MNVFLNGNGCHLDKKEGTIFKNYQRRYAHAMFAKKIAAQLAVLENLAKLKQCKTCNLHLMRINKLTHNWNYGQKLLSKRWKASLPGFVHQVKYDPDQYKFVCLCVQRKEDSAGKEIISTEEVLCNYDYIA